MRSFSNFQAAAESKLSGQDDLIRRLKAQVEELTRQNHELNGIKARLSQENYTLHHQVQELDRANAELTRVKVLLQQQVDDLKARLDEESNVRTIFLFANIRRFGKEKNKAEFTV